MKRYNRLGIAPTHTHRASLLAALHKVSSTSIYIQSTVFLKHDSEEKQPRNT